MHLASTHSLVDFALPLLGVELTRLRGVAQERSIYSLGSLPSSMPCWMYMIVIYIAIRFRMT